MSDAGGCWNAHLLLHWDERRGREPPVSHFDFSLLSSQWAFQRRDTRKYLGMAYLPRSEAGPCDVSQSKATRPYFGYLRVLRLQSFTCPA